MITQAEWEIMRVVWKENSTAQQVHQALEEHFHWSESTVKTMLGRLVKKGFLHYEKVNRHFLYRAAVSQHELVVSHVKHDLDGDCNKNKGHILSDVLQGIELSRDDIDHLIQQLTIKREKAPQTVPCRCRKGQCQCCAH